MTRQRANFISVKLRKEKLLFIETSLKLYMEKRNEIILKSAEKMGYFSINLLKSTGYVT